MTVQNDGSVQDDGPKRRDRPSNRRAKRRDRPSNRRAKRRDRPSNRRGLLDENAGRPRPLVAAIDGGGRLVGEVEAQLGGEVRRSSRPTVLPWSRSTRRKPGAARAGPFSSSARRRLRRSSTRSRRPDRWRPVPFAGAVRRRGGRAPGAAVEVEAGPGPRRGPARRCLCTAAGCLCTGARRRAVHKHGEPYTSTARRWVEHQAKRRDKTAGRSARGRFPCRTASRGALRDKGRRRSSSTAAGGFDWSKFRDTGSKPREVAPRSRSTRRGLASGTPF